MTYCRGLLRDTRSKLLAGRRRHVELSWTTMTKKFRHKIESRSCREHDVDLEVRHLVRQGISTHTPHGGRYCRRSLVGSLPRGIPTVVDESVEVRVIRIQLVIVTQYTRFVQVQAVSLA